MKDNTDMLLHEKRLWSKGYKLIAGVDEAGRGPLAGSVYAAAVILDPDVYIEGVNDSKKLSAKKREELFDVICQKAVAWHIACIDAQEIDNTDILTATLKAMNTAVDNLKIQPDYVLIDGNQMRGMNREYETVVKGDATSASIAAASILAKVARDRYMCEQAKLYPQYFFEKHKGYGTKLHCDMLKQYGPCDIHRKTFLTKILPK